MRRRAVSVLLAGVMTLGLAAAGLTGCGSAGEGKESIRLMVWSPQNDQSKDNGEWLQTMCEAFADEHPEWDITFVYGIADEASAAGTVSQDAEASADVFMYANDTLTTDRCQCTGKIRREVQRADRVHELGGSPGFPDHGRRAVRRAVYNEYLVHVL